jgi:hypothetical protein
MALEQFSVYKLHVNLEGQTLDDMLEETARSVWEALIEQPQHHERSSFELIKNALKAALRQYIIGIDNCGTNPACRGGRKFDPWIIG